MAKPGETFAALNEKTYDLAADMLVIADANGADDLAGVMGGERTGVVQIPQMFLEIAILIRFRLPLPDANLTFIQMRATVLNAAWMPRRRRPWPDIFHVW